MNKEETKEYARKYYEKNKESYILEALLGVFASIISKEE